MLERRFGVETLWGVIAFSAFGLAVFWGSIFLYKDGQTFLEGVLVEASGFVFDIALFGVVMVALRHKWERGDRVRRYLEELGDFVDWNADEASYRSAGLVRRVVTEGEQGRLPYGLNLAGVNFRAQNLRQAFLYYAHLDRADLRDADLSGATLVKADLSQANLIGADLSGADLNSADLSGADLSGADVRWAEHLKEEQLRSALNWELAYRDPDHAYGEPIPTPPDDE